MKIEIHIHIHNPGEPESYEAGPQGTDALVEHGDHDSTPRRISFNADDRQCDDDE